MYLQKLASWTSIEWNELFAYMKLTNTNKQEILKDILTSDTKDRLEEGFPSLREIGVLNGIGPNWLGKFARWIITLCFKGVNSDHHDISYLIGGTRADRLRSDRGLIKYSLISLKKSRDNVFLLQLNPLSKLLLISIFYVGAIIQCAIILFCYIMVRSFGWIGSFRYTNS